MLQFTVDGHNPLQSEIASTIYDTSQFCKVQMSYTCFSKSIRGVNAGASLTFPRSWNGEMDNRWR